MSIPSSRLMVALELRRIVDERKAARPAAETHGRVPAERQPLGLPVVADRTLGVPWRVDHTEPNPFSEIDHLAVHQLPVHLRRLPGVHLECGPSGLQPVCPTDEDVAIHEVGIKLGVGILCDLGVGLMDPDLCPGRGHQFAVPAGVVVVAVGVQDRAPRRRA